MYIIVALLGVLGLLHNKTVFNTFAIILVLIYNANPDQFMLLSNPNHAYLGLAFLFGSLIYINQTMIPIKFPYLMIFAGMAACTWKSPYYHFFALLTYSYAALWIGFNTRLKLPKLDKYGDFSYGLYLYAYPLQQLSIYYFGPETPILINLSAFAGAMGLSAASWFLIEKPALSLKNSDVLKKRPVPFWKKVPEL